MKRLNKKLTTFILAGVCAASIGVASARILTFADEATSTAKTYNITTVFNKSEKATIGSKTVSEKETIAFTLGNGDSVSMKKDLAFKWFAAKNDAKYLNIQFSFESLDFENVIFTIESATSVANEDEKAVNAVKFTSNGTNLSAVVINGETESDKVVDLGAVKDVELAFAAGAAFDEFAVKVNGNDAGTFTEVGANFADYTDEICPLKIEAKWADTTDKKAVVLLKEINGQKFDNVTKSTGDSPTYSVTDTAAPVLVVNEDITGFQYGTAFTLNYEKIDVLQTTSLSETKKFYQYNPADKKADISKTLSTSTYFMDSVYYTKADGTGYSKTKDETYTNATSVYMEEGAEYVAITFDLKDDSNATVTYDLSWYAEASAVVSKDLTDDSKDPAETVSTDYIKVVKKEEGAVYKFIEATGGANVITDATAFENAISEYQSALAKKTQDAVEGDDEKITIPDLEWLIEDKTGSYRALKFTISYKTPASSSASSNTALNYSGLTIPTKKAGDYEFKVFATDRTGNGMEYYLDDELVTVSTSNIWEIDEIPTFYFSVKDDVVKVKDSSDSNRKVSKALDQTYTLSGMTITGSSSTVSEYALYRFDASKYNGTIDESKFSAIKYETVREKAITKANLALVGTTYKTYFDLYMDIYTKELATLVGAGDATAIKNAFVRIDPYNAKITEDDEEWEYNKYNWNESAKSFTTAEEGSYLIVMDVRESDNGLQRAFGYKLVTVDFKKDVVKGNSEFMTWVKNNVVSVVLFGVAAVLLVIIVILLFVKPSDETLEDVDAKAEKKAKSKEE